ncbi:hypothetical protein GGX14DRAFT_402866 [Mycena pura]|uniref:Uncharacterized protein n=1 Tax=Mycena pura TaxID=153505 RepID=A0AAD6V0X6_9AGAR|nr:hypothetical protein GGX14DRAFT_402866 [Mycena pura]
MLPAPLPRHPLLLHGAAAASSQGSRFSQGSDISSDSSPSQARNHKSESSRLSQPASRLGLTEARKRSRRVKQAIQAFKLLCCLLAGCRPLLHTTSVLAKQAGSARSIMTPRRRRRRLPCARAAPRRARHASRTAAARIRHDPPTHRHAYALATRRRAVHPRPCCTIAASGAAPRTRHRFTNWLSKTQARERRACCHRRTHSQDTDADAEGETEGDRETEEDGEEEVDNGDSEYHQDNGNSDPEFVPPGARRRGRSAQQLARWYSPSGSCAGYGAGYEYPANGYDVRFSGWLMRGCRVSGVSNGMKMGTFLELIPAPDLVLAPDTNMESSMSFMAPDVHSDGLARRPPTTRSGLSTDYNKRDPQQPWHTGRLPTVVLNDSELSRWRFGRVRHGRRQSEYGFFPTRSASGHKGPNMAKPPAITILYLSHLIFKLFLHSSFHPGPQYRSHRYA